MIGVLIRTVVLAALAALAVAATFFVLALQDQSAVEFAVPATPEDVRAARNFLHGVRSSVESGSDFSTTQAELDSVMRLGARLLPGFRGRVFMHEDSVEGVASIPVPLLDERRWLNLRVVVPQFEGRFALSEVHLGGFELPPGPTLQVARAGANLVFGERVGDIVLAAVTSMQIDEGAIAFDLAMDEIGQNGIMRAVFGTLRGTDLPAREDVDQYYLLFYEALEAGSLPDDGSFLPHLGFMVDAARQRSSPETAANSFTAAMLALAEACGARNFTQVIGGFDGAGFFRDETWERDCANLTLNGRVDSRMHFVTSAAIQAASNLGFAVSVGEFKELYDTLRSSGFDFTDIAANNSGIRFSNTFMARPAAEWPALLSLMEREDQVIISFDGIPSAMSGQDFAETYGDLESPQYDAMIAQIEAKIDMLPIHRRP